MEKIIDIMGSAINELNKVKDSLHNHSEENMAINIIIDDSDSPNSVFVEIENDQGQSIRIGEELRTEEGYRKIRISTADVIGNDKI